MEFVLTKKVTVLRGERKSLDHNRLAVEPLTPLTQKNLRTTAAEALCRGSLSCEVRERRGERRREGYFGGSPCAFSLSKYAAMVLPWASEHLYVSFRLTQRI